MPADRASGGQARVARRHGRHTKDQYSGRDHSVPIRDWPAGGYSICDTSHELAARHKSVSIERDNIGT